MPVLLFTYTVARLPADVMATANLSFIATARGTQSSSPA